MIGIIELEQLMARGWQGTETEVVGDWLLRAGSGFTGRANSVLPLGSPDCPLARAMEKVTAFYRQRDLPPLFQIPACPETADIDGYLTELGWTAFNASVVLTADMAAAAEAAPTPHPHEIVNFSDRPSSSWLDGYLYRGSPLPPTAVQVLVNAEHVTFASMRDGRGQAVVVRGVLTDGWLGITALTVNRQRRREGLGSRLMGALFRWAADRGAHSVYLQVAAENDAAIALYQRLGFTEHHRYLYRQAGRQH